MLDRLKLSLMDIVLIILLVAGAALFYQLSQSNTEVEQENARLEIRHRAAQLDLSEADKAATVEDLRQRLEKTRSTLTKTSLPGEADAIAFTSQILKSAERNNVIIGKWDSSYTSVDLNGLTYYAIKHSLSAVGNADALIGFIKSLTQTSVATAIQDMNINGIEKKEEEEGEDLWQMGMALLVYYSQN